MYAGADIIGEGDAAASLVGPGIYREVVAPFESRFVEAIHGMGALVRLHICGNMSRSVRDMGLLGADIVDLDAPTDMAAARLAMGPDQVLLGNLNPVSEVLQGTPASILAATEQRHGAAGSRFIVGAGCEIPRQTPIENLRALSDYAHHHVP